MEKKRTINSFDEIFREMIWDWPDSYGSRDFKPVIRSSSDGRKYLTINKYTICSDGSAEYKGMYSYFNAQLLWPKVEQFVKLFEVTDAEKVLFDE